MCTLPSIRSSSLHVVGETISSAPRFHYCTSSLHQSKKSARSGRKSNKSAKRDVALPPPIRISTRFQSKNSSMGCSVGFNPGDGSKLDPDKLIKELATHMHVDWKRLKKKTVRSVKVSKEDWVILMKNDSALSGG
ncbi:hypothetical protein L1987_33943 [Smallanthus sonchifolius]|uniref:Uncharacterized protein n=1 Tax=Smallanthus sonchifolius TaxID=185202 RepID=A0ACB9HU70_9ASTR|nr:hypothetical protein L1987_33943 [Smallanthus sonchifolius]